MTNEGVIRKYAPPDRYNAGMKLLSDFNVAFNSSFHLVTHLYECNPNPFIAEDGVSVDLTGGRKGGADVGMGNGTTINFSLPSAFHGETEAAGLCTIRLLDRLQVCLFIDV
jgi:hypothetical protein